jgi:hypothetical protein
MSNEFMIGHSGVPPSATQAQAAYEVGWCRRCGRRLGYEGKCPNCDAWWRSGYIAVGIPVLCLNLLVIGFIVSKYGMKPPTNAAISSPASSLLAPTLPQQNYNTSSNYNRPSAYAPSFQPTTYTSPLSSPNSSFGSAAPPIPPDPWEVRLNELQELRQTVWETEAEYRQKYKSPVQSPSPYESSYPGEGKNSNSTMNASS